MKNKKEKIVTDNSSLPEGNLPENAKQMVNRYGTYEIQATADTDNQYPAIAQGFNKKIIKTDRQNKHYKGDFFEKGK